MKVKIISENTPNECDVCEKIKEELLSIFPVNRYGVSIRFCTECQDNLAKLIKFA